ncbi:hypothetical protein GCM10009660_09180 [Catellatospora bangladeshensis]
MNAGLTTAALIARMAATPSSGPTRRRPGITIAENAKNTPAISPQPRAATTVNVRNMGTVKPPTRSTAAGPPAPPHERPTGHPLDVRLHRHDGSGPATDSAARVGSPARGRQAPTSRAAR